MHVKNIAHRGGAGLWPENSCDAFRNAIAMGADGAELDIQLSRDGEVVVFHDFHLKPALCRDIDGQYLKAPTSLIKDLTYAELRRFDIGRADAQSAYAGAHPDVKGVDGERIPHLAEVIALAKAAPNPFTLFVELKTSFADRRESAAPEVLADAALKLLAAEDYLHHTVFVTFDWPGLLHIKKRAPEVECWFTTMDQSWFGAGPATVESDPPAEVELNVLRHWANNGLSPWAGGFDAVHYDGSIVQAIKAAGGDGWFPPYADATAENIKAAQDLGLKCGAWTVNAATDMQRLAQNGLDAICTDRPDIFQTALNPEGSARLFM